LWKSDTEHLAVLARPVAQGSAEGMGEVRLVGVQVVGLIGVAGLSRRQG